MNFMTENFLLTRSLDYTRTRDFVVQAQSREEAEERLIDYCENSDWENRQAWSTA